MGLFLWLQTSLVYTSLSPVFSIFHRAFRPKSATLNVNTPSLAAHIVTFRALCQALCCCSTSASPAQVMPTDRPVVVRRMHHIIIGTDPYYGAGYTIHGVAVDVR